MQGQRADFEFAGGRNAEFLSSKDMVGAAFDNETVGL